MEGRKKSTLIPETKCKSNKINMGAGIPSEIISSSSIDKGNLTSRENGNKVKKMVEAFEQRLK